MFPANTPKRKSHFQERNLSPDHGALEKQIKSPFLNLKTFQLNSPENDDDDESLSTKKKNPPQDRPPKPSSKVKGDEITMNKTGGKTHHSKLTLNLPSPYIGAREPSSMNLKKKRAPDEKPNKQATKCVYINLLPPQTPKSCLPRA
ncbi:hypothetical protein JTE90_005700 [Oedothorax gibbosus]|uniref:Uncharacterized protein n=1 Tax=Oedothorax gibbosus TaxID=931172 RepID=A0AAV6UGE0_9ARAC|nr:hypothetical protein JTE90_005700 [Oedothorax gibbosus]